LLVNILGVSLPPSIAALKATPEEVLTPRTDWSKDIGASILRTGDLSLGRRKETIGHCKICDGRSDNDERDYRGDDFTVRLRCLLDCPRKRSTLITLVCRYL